MLLLFFFFFNDTATTEIYTLSLHDALPIFLEDEPAVDLRNAVVIAALDPIGIREADARVSAQALLGPQDRENGIRSEEHTSELQSQSNIVCRLLLEKKKKTA